MRKILAGSTAIKQTYTDFPRVPKDIDYIVDREKQSTREIEYLYNPVICDRHSRDCVIPLDELLTVKMSHIFWHDNQFDKTMFDIQWLLNKGHNYNKSLFHELYDFWTKYFGPNKRSELTGTAMDFFDNAVNPNIPVDHDELHTYIVDKPAFHKILVGEVETCDQKFLDLGHEDKLAIIQEESMVMAAERYSGENYRNRYSKQLKKMILSHLTLEEAIFAITNYKTLNNCPFNFMDKINTKLQEKGFETLV